MFPEFHAIIPARYASTRFPGKPLAMILGMPMIQHVYRRAMESEAFASAHVATDDERIYKVCRELLVPVVMTGAEHVSGTDRVYEAACLLDLDQDSVVVNIQGDEPALDPRMLVQLRNVFTDASVSVATLARPLDPSDAALPDIVKVVCAGNGDALYFSRAPIPFVRDTGNMGSEFLAHVGLYAFRLPALRRFTELEPSPLELTEQLEQLRLLENGVPIRVALTDCSTHGVDRPEDIAIVESLLKERTPCKPY